MMRRRQSLYQAGFGPLFSCGLAPVLRGWISYSRLTEVKGILEELDGWPCGVFTH